MNAIHLPQQHPFRFVDEVTRLGADWLETRFRTAGAAQCHRGNPALPTELLIEGAAQSTVLLFERLVEPLRPDEMPVLGQVRIVARREAGWDEVITYVVRLERALADLGLFTVRVTGDGGLIAEGQIGVAKVKAEPTAPHGGAI